MNYEQQTILDCLETISDEIDTLRDELKRCWEKSR